MLGVASDGLVAPPGLLNRPSDLSQLGVNAGVGSGPGLTTLAVGGIWLSAGRPIRREVQTEGVLVPWPD